VSTRRQARKSLILKKPVTITKLQKLFKRPIHFSNP
jgi:hypothetical protein